MVITSFELFRFEHEYKQERHLQWEFLSPTSQLTNASKNNAEYTPDLTPLFNELQNKIENS
jgi:hypothetical protein